MKRKIDSKNKNRQLRHTRIRKRLKGTATVPRLSVFRGLCSLNVQLIDDISGKTLCAVNTKEIKEDKTDSLNGKVAKAYLVGKLLAEKAKEKKIEQAVFDRGGYQFHGRVKAVADGAKENGLKI